MSEQYFCSSLPFLVTKLTEYSSPTVLPVFSFRTVRPSEHARVTISRAKSQCHASNNSSRTGVHIPISYVTVLQERF